MAKKSTKVTLGSLTDDILGIIKDEEIGDSNNTESRYETGIKMFDFRNGRLDGEGDLSLGIDGGKIFTIIGKPGSGKTTFGIMTALNIISKYKDAQFIHLDYENATSKSRVYSIARVLGVDKEELKKKYIYLNKEIYTESLYKLTKAVAKLKMKKYDDIKIDTGRVDEDGNPLYVLPPTIMLVDSWASVIPKNISDEEELSGQMSSTSIARTNNSVIRRITGPMGSANIILIVINHINKKVEIGPIKTSNDLNYLGQDETSPGGLSVLYLADTLLKVQASSKLEEEKDFGIKGFTVIATLIKSRSNESGRKFEMVYSQSEGFHNFYTNFNYIKSLKSYLKGNGKAYYFEFAPTKKFTQKNVYELYKSDEEWAQQFDELMDSFYYNFITSKGYNEDEEYLDEDEEFSLYGTYKNKDVFINNIDQTLVWEDGSDFDGLVNKIKIYDPEMEE